ncbi:MAG TPA: SDR family NAD(P)-dependent oxidoreductase, partial [Paraburkholderia sp.]|nr:SDR family NAD(P)-dependent oxidoreductase [Paraburkholderia sp.]
MQQVQADQTQGTAQATLARKVALVTGAGSGIGRAAARKLLEHGYSVVLTGRRQQLLDELADEA